MRSEDLILPTIGPDQMVAQVGPSAAISRVRSFASCRCSAADVLGQGETTERLTAICPEEEQRNTSTNCQSKSKRFSGLSLGGSCVDPS
jgi:hypothetical protein